MQILLNTDFYADGREEMVEHLASVVPKVLGQFGTRIINIEACLTDADGSHPAGARDVYCTLAAQPVGLEPVVARHHAGTAQQAIHGALRKLGCNLAFTFEKHDQQFAFPVVASSACAWAAA